MLVQIAPRGEKHILDELRDKFATGALAVIDLDIGHWRQIARASGTLVDYQTPRGLV